MSGGHFARSGVHVGAFGDKFRTAREKNKVSLEDVSKVTKIATRMLQAIEDERFDQLPGGVFNKGFIRAYAKQVGLNEEEVVSEYLACLRQKQVEAQAAFEHPAEPVAKNRPGKQAEIVSPKVTSASAADPAQAVELPDLQLPRAEDVRPPRRQFMVRPAREFPWRLAVWAALVIVLAAVLWHRHSRAARAESVTQSATTPASTSPTSSNPTPAPDSRPVEATPGAATVKPAMAPTTADTLLGVESAAGKSAVKEQEIGTTAIQPKIAKTEETATATPLTLVIRASENSWISVSADGLTVSQETLIAPARTSVRAHREIVARVGNAAGVTFLWNNQEIPAQGGESEVKTFVFDASGMRVLPPGQSPTPAQN